jgi:hypothetical protein
MSFALPGISFAASRMRFTKQSTPFASNSYRLPVKEKAALFRTAFSSQKTKNHKCF